MEFNPTGLIAALTAFFSIWAGHVGVRWIEARSTRLWIPVTVAVFAGAAALLLAVHISTRSAAAAAGIAGTVFLWDAFELYRQEGRVRRGRAPANPGNPRHARFLAEGPHATTIDWLDRAPRGRPYSRAELAGRKASQG